MCIFANHPEHRPRPCLNANRCNGILNFSSASHSNRVVHPLCLPISLHQPVKGKLSHILPRDRISDSRTHRMSIPQLLPTLSLPTHQQTRLHIRKRTEHPLLLRALAHMLLEILLHLPLVDVRIVQKPMVEWDKQERDIAGCAFGWDAGG